MWKFEPVNGYNISLASLRDAGSSTRGRVGTERLRSVAPGPCNGASIPYWLGETEHGQWKQGGSAFASSGTSPTGPRLIRKVVGW